MTRKLQLEISSSDQDATDTYAIDLDLGAKPSWSWKMKKAGDAGTQKFSASALKASSSSAWISQGSVFGSGIPAFILPADAFGKLMKTGSTKLAGLWLDEAASVTFTKRLALTLTVGGKKSKVDALKLSGDAELVVLPSPELPLVLRYEADDCSFEVKSLSELPKTIAALPTMPTAPKVSSNSPMAAEIALVMSKSAPLAKRIGAAQHLGRAEDRASLVALFRATGEAGAIPVVQACRAALDLRIAHPDFTSVVEEIFAVEPKNSKLSPIHLGVANYLDEQHAKVKPLLVALQRMSKSGPPAFREILAAKFEYITS